MSYKGYRRSDTAWITLSVRSENSRDCLSWYDNRPALGEISRELAGSQATRDFSRQRADGFIHCRVKWKCRLSYDVNSFHIGADSMGSMGPPRPKICGGDTLKSPCPTEILLSQFFFRNCKTSHFLHSSCTQPKWKCTVKITNVLVCK